MRVSPGFFLLSFLRWFWFQVWRFQNDVTILLTDPHRNKTESLEFAVCNSREFCCRNVYIIRHHVFVLGGKTKRVVVLSPSSPTYYHFSALNSGFQEIQKIQPPANLRISCKWIQQTESGTTDSCFRLFRQRMVPNYTIIIKIVVSLSKWPLNLESHRQFLFFPLHFFIIYYSHTQRRRRFHLRMMIFFCYFYFHVMKWMNPVRQPCINISLDGIHVENDNAHALTRWERGLYLHCSW